MLLAQPIIENDISYELDKLMGEVGMLLSFTSDVWDINCIRYVFWLQKHSYKLCTYGINSVLITPNTDYELNLFDESMPRDMPFHLLADPTEQLKQKFEMKKAGYILLGSEGEELGRWYIKENASLSLKSLLTRLR